MITPEIKQFIFDNYKDMYNRELVDAINKKFNANVTIHAVKNVKHRNGLKSNKPVGGVKGCKVWNTGLRKGDERLKNLEKTWFKKGVSNYKELPVGSESCKDGYVIVKQADGTWKLKTHIIWEQHYGPIPDKHMIIHADGDKHNFDIDNLMMIDWAIMIRMNRKRRFSADSNLIKTYVLISKIEQEIYKINKKKE